MLSCTALEEPLPTAIRTITEAIPIVIPSTVSAVRMRCDISPTQAVRIVSSGHQALRETACSTADRVLVDREVGDDAPSARRISRSAWAATSSSWVIITIVRRWR